MSMNPVSDLIVLASSADCMAPSGTLNTPRLLMLLGIGPAAQLVGPELPVLRDLRPSCPSTCSMPQAPEAAELDREIRAFMNALLAE